MRVGLIGAGNLARGLALGWSRLAAETMAGSATLLAVREFDTLSIRREVTSPAGTTARGLEALERGGVRSASQDAMEAVLARSSR